MSPRRPTVLITGCSEGGIGDALACEFHRRGLRVFATARDITRIRHLQIMGMDVLSLDVIDPESIRRAVEAVVDETDGSLDLLVNNAGSGYAMPLLDCTIAKARMVFELNVISIMTMTQAFLPLLRSCPGPGKIINIGSIAGIVPLPWTALYNSSKAAVRSLSDSMRLELAPLRIQVIHVITGGVRTNFWTNQMGTMYNEGLPAISRYRAARKEVERGMRMASFEKHKITPQLYARSVVDNALRPSPKKHLWAGGSVWRIWFVDSCLWRSAWDLPGVLGRKYELQVVRKKISS